MSRIYSRVRVVRKPREVAVFGYNRSDVHAVRHNAGFAFRKHRVMAPVPYHNHVLDGFARDTGWRHDVDCLNNQTR